MSHYVLPFSSAETTLLQAGGKGANISKLAQAGFPIPAGFIVTTDAYRAFVETNQLQARILTLTQSISTDDSMATEYTAADIRALFEQGAMPNDIAAEITAAYHTSSIPAVAVRSSATAEDLPGLAF